MSQHRPSHAATTTSFAAETGPAPRALDLDALDAAHGGAELRFREFGFQFEGPSVGDGLSRLFNDGYQSLFPNAPSNRVQMAQQEREIRDAMSDLRDRMPMNMPESMPPVNDANVPDARGVEVLEMPYSESRGADMAFAGSYGPPGGSPEAHAPTDSGPDGNFGGNDLSSPDVVLANTNLDASGPAGVDYSGDVSGTAYGDAYASVEV